MRESLERENFSWNAKEKEFASPGGIVIPLYPPNSPYLKMDRIKEPEQYSMSQAVPGRISSIELIKKLVAHGAQVNAKMTRRANLSNTRLNEIGATPFMLAALTADAELMRTLAALGADPFLPNVDNSTPLMAGRRTRHALAGR